MRDHIETITDLLLGAAYADKRLEGREVDSIRDLLGKMLGSAELPAELEARFRSFSPAAFDPTAAAAELADLAAERRRNVLDLVATVNESDEVLDFDEDRYLRRVASGLGFSEEEIKDLTVEIVPVETLSGLLA
ncbi:MAG: TerB family tellurite resistance protein [Myxococcales bacterium]|nr:TerB family tellurite resistance protein [Myxococcales bacterium]MCB9706380.1 TerB family tellurite resistance protein [Myxococcales bacterium]